MATLWSNILTHFTIYLPLNLVSFLILRHSFIQCQWIFANWSLSKFEKNVKESIKQWKIYNKFFTTNFVVNLSPLSIIMFMCGLWCWQLLGRTSEKDEQSDEAKEVHFFVIFHELELSSSSSSSLDSWTVLIRLLLLTSIYFPSVLPLSISY